MARTGIHYEKNKWLTGDNSVNIQGRRRKHNNPECKEDDAPK